MTLTLYLDVYFLINGCMDLILLSLVKYFLRLPCRKMRLLLAAAAGAAWTCVITVLYLKYELQQHGEISALEHILELLLQGPFNAGFILWIAFGKAKWKNFIKRFVCLYLTGAFVGGCVELLAGVLPKEWLFTYEPGYAQMRTVPVFLFGGVVFLGSKVFRRWLFQSGRNQHFYKVTLRNQGKMLTVTALLDTGNRLYEPYGHQPVHIVTKEVAEYLGGFLEHPVLIPFQSVGASHGLLVGSRIEAMRVENEAGEVRNYEMPWIAMAAEPLSAGHRYEMLLHEESE